MPRRTAEGPMRAFGPSPPSLLCCSFGERAGPGSLRTLFQTAAGTDGHGPSTMLAASILGNRCRLPPGTVRRGAAQRPRGGPLWQGGALAGAAAGTSRPAAAARSLPLHTHFCSRCGNQPPGFAPPLRFGAAVSLSGKSPNSRYAEPSASRPRPPLWHIGFKPQNMRRARRERTMTRAQEPRGRSRSDGIGLQARRSAGMSMRSDCMCRLASRSQVGAIAGRLAHAYQ